jgi:thiosulfate/3-mercaptopyruvate sulfurtransferase
MPLSVFLVACLLSFRAWAGSAAVIVTAAEAARDPSAFQIVDAREPSLFEKEHLPSSQSLHWMELTEEKPGLWAWLFGNPARWGVVKADATVESRLRELGFSRSRPFLVVGDPAEPGAEGRTAWNLLYWGAERVALMEGGYPAWAALPEAKPAKGKAERPTSPGDFTLSLQPERRATLSEVNQALRTPGRSLLDVRTEAEFRGDRMKGQKRGGHLPRAELVPISSLYEKDGAFVSAEKLRALVKNPSSPITYCTGGVRSSLLAVLLEARLGIRAENYDASLWEYSASPDLPLVQ